MVDMLVSGAMSSLSVLLFVDLVLLTGLTELVGTYLTCCSYCCQKEKNNNYQSKSKKKSWDRSYFNSIDKKGSI